MSIQRSDNCSAYTDTVSTLVELDVAVSGEPDCSTKKFAFSCQRKAFEKPDEQTRTFLLGQAREELQRKGCSVDNASFNFSTNLVGAREMEYDAKKLARDGLASNCFIAGNDPNDATHQIVAKCNPMYDMTNSKGERVRNFNMTFTSDLSACDVSDEAMPQLLEDARKVAAHNAATNGYTVDKPEHLSCNFSVLPQI